MNSDLFIQDLVEVSFDLVFKNLDTSSMLSSLITIIKGKYRHRVLVIILIGGAASGKTTLAQKIVSSLDRAGTISTDDFVIGSRAYRREHCEGKNPLKKYDFGLLREKVDEIRTLEEHGSVLVPVYDDETGTGVPTIDKDVLEISKESYLTTRLIPKVDFLIVEGDFQPLKNPDYIIYFHVPDKVRLKNRIRRDISTRGSTNIRLIKENFLLRQILQHERYTLPWARKANMLITINPNVRSEYEFNIFVRNNKTSKKEEN